MSPLIELKNIYFSYGEGFTLDVPSLKIENNTSIGLVGNNGSGKSTLMEIICNLKKEYSGQVYKHKDLNEGDITMLLQNPYLLKRSVLENLIYPLKIREPELKSAQLRARAEEVIEMLALDRTFLKRKWSHLSGGEAQRIALGARLIMKPRLLVLDEPTTYVDADSARIIKNVITTYSENRRMTFVIASHDVIWLNSICKNIYRMSKGKIIGTGNDNIIYGPWLEDENGLNFSQIDKKNRIYASHVQDVKSQGLLSANDIILSEEYPQHVSAQNKIEARVAVISPGTDSNVNVSLDCGHIHLTAEVTVRAVKEMNLVPGQKIYCIFKATAIRFY